MPFAKGNTFGKKGKPKGAVNKTTISIKNAFLEAFEKRGGVKALLAWADDEPGEFYRIMSKLLPREMDVTMGGEVNVKLTERLAKALERVNGDKQ